MATSLSPFPFAHHGSLLGVQTVLLGFVALYLPRSTFLLTEIPEQASSKDRPQHPFLKPLTADPVITLGWLCLGAIIVQVWWAENLRSLWKERDITRTAAAGGDEQRVKSSLTEGRQRWKVCVRFLAHVICSLMTNESRLKMPPSQHS
jgi:phosphatidylinositol glycan class F